MQRSIKLDTHFLRPSYKIGSIIKEYGDQQNRATNVKADHTHWHVHKDNKFDEIVNYLHEIYPKHTIEELWGCTYRQGDFTQAHTHYGFDLAFVWFVDTCSFCSPLIFPDTQHLWMKPHHVITPEVGKLYVFNAEDIHYVEPHTCEHPRIIMSGNVRRNINTEVLENDPWH